MVKLLKNRRIYVIAIIFGLLTCYFIYDYLTKVEGKITNIQYDKVVVAAGEIKSRTKITGEMLRICEIPQEYIHPNALHEKKEVIGAITTVDLMEGETILQQKIVKQGDVKHGLSFIVPQGKRAVTVPVDDVSGIAGLIRPGDSVDVAAVVDIKDIKTQREIPYSLIVLQNIEVLAVDQNLHKGQKSEEAKNVTLAISVKDSIPLLLASQKGVIRLMLRSPIDNSTFVTTPFNPSDFLK